MNVTHYRIFPGREAYPLVAAAGKSVPVRAVRRLDAPAASSAPRPAGTVMIANDL
jgi:hypothetical protein